VEKQDIEDLAATFFMKVEKLKDDIEFLDLKFDEFKDMSDRMRQLEFSCQEAESRASQGFQEFTLRLDQVKIRAHAQEAEASHAQQTIATIQRQFESLHQAMAEYRMEATADLKEVNLKVNKQLAEVDLAVKANTDYLTLCEGRTNKSLSLVGTFDARIREVELLIAELEKQVKAVPKYYVRKEEVRQKL